MKPLLLESNFTSILLKNIPWFMFNYMKQICSQSEHTLFQEYFLSSHRYCSQWCLNLSLEPSVLNAAFSFLKLEHFTSVQVTKLWTFAGRLSDLVSFNNIVFISLASSKIWSWFNYVTVAWVGWAWVGVGVVCSAWAVLSITWIGLDGPVVGSTVTESDSVVLFSTHKEKKWFSCIQKASTQNYLI